MTLQDIILNPLTLVVFLHTILRKSLIWKPSPYTYASITDIGSYFTLFALLILLAELKQRMEPHLQNVWPPVRYVGEVILFLAILETGMVIFWASLEHYLREGLFHIVKYIDVLATNTRLRTIVQDIVVTGVGITLLTLALSTTVTGHYIQRKINAFLSM
ncbi:hypothetical protein DMENIID0001_039560 [Sergentomyia squamirostris]